MGSHTAGRAPLTGDATLDTSAQQISLLDGWLIAIIVLLGVAVGVLSYRLAVRRAVGDVRTENVRLREAESADEALRERLHDLNRSLRATLDPTTVAGVGLETLGEGLRLDRSYLRLAHDDNLDSLTAQWHRPTLDALPDVDSPGSVEEMRRLYERGRPMVSTDVLDDAFFATPAGRVWQERTGVRGSMTVAVAVDGVPVGIITCLSLKPRDWRPYEIRWTEAVAADLGRALTQAKLYTERTEAVRRLEELDRAKDDFLSTVSHELRTPLTSMAGYLEVLQEDDNLTPSQSQILQVVERNTERLRGLVENLLALSSHGPDGRGATEQIDLVDVVDRVVDQRLPRAESATVTLTPHTPDHPVTVVGDPTQLSRALGTVVDNALKFTPRGGTVSVRLDADPAASFARIEVADDGVGIPANEVDSVSAAFARARNARATEAPGAGLGLSIAHRILNVHGGTLAITSEEHRGTTVVLALPRTRSLSTELPRHPEQQGEGARSSS